MQKDFENWIKLKAIKHSMPVRPLFKERDIWWCSIGVNIGEITSDDFKEIREKIRNFIP